MATPTPLRGPKPLEPRARRAIAAWRVASSDPNRDDYLVTQDGGVWTCDCEGCARWGKTCGHIRSCMLDLPDPVPSGTDKVLQMPRRLAPRPFPCATCGQWPAARNQIDCAHCLTRTGGSHDGQ